jgi:hypothetical protein
MPQKFKNTCCDELNPGRLPYEFVWMDQAKHLIQSKTEVALRCQSFTIESFCSKSWLKNLSAESQDLLQKLSIVKL